MAGGKLCFLSKCDGDGFISSEKSGDTIKQTCKNDGDQAEFCTLLGDIIKSINTVDVA
jgi:hypothetical protein